MSTAWYKLASRRKMNLHRVRRCPCGQERPTVEFSGVMPSPKSPPDRCPRCFVGQGRVTRISYWSSMPVFFDKSKLRAPRGSVYRRRQCVECGEEWRTYETLVDGEIPETEDIAQCSCGKRMTLRRKS